MFYTSVIASTSASLRASTLTEIDLDEKKRKN
jgi:hypothetical protein